jgi:signal transduction histidine kinase
MVELVEGLRSVTDRLPQPAAIRVEWEVRAPSAGEMVTDIPKVALILRNLVSNAFKFTDEGTVRVRIRAEDRSLLLIVSDTGMGIAAENLPMIFEMFRQLDSGGSSRGGGVGLGLYIVKQMVQRLNGTVEVESEPGRGSTFRIRIPGYDPPEGGSSGLGAGEGESAEGNRPGDRAAQD